MAKKVVRLTESDLMNIVERCVYEYQQTLINEGKLGNLARTAALGAGLAGGILGGMNGANAQSQKPINNTKQSTTLQNQRFVTMDNAQFELTVEYYENGGHGIEPIQYINGDYTYYSSDLHKLKKLATKETVKEYEDCNIEIKRLSHDYENGIGDMKNITKDEFNTYIESIRKKQDTIFIKMVHEAQDSVNSENKIILYQGKCGGWTQLKSKISKINKQISENPYINRFRVTTKVKIRYFGEIKEDTIYLGVYDNLNDLYDKIYMSIKQYGNPNKQFIPDVYHNYHSLSKKIHRDKDGNEYIWNGERFFPEKDKYKITP